MTVLKPEVDPKDIAEIEKELERYFVDFPHNPDKTLRQQVVFSNQETRALVGKVLAGLGGRGYAVMKPKPE